MQNVTNHFTPKLSSEESAALVKFARQLEDNQVTINVIATRTPIPIERLQALINIGEFPSAEFCEEEQIWYMPMSEWNVSDSISSKETYGVRDRSDPHWIILSV